MRTMAKLLSLLLALWLWGCGAATSGAPPGEEGAMSQDVVSAQVVLRAADGKAPDPRTPITAANIAEYAPSTASARVTRASFERAGFSVGPLVGNSMAISAPAETFERAFKITVVQRSGGDAVAQADGGESYELPLAGLPPDVARHIAAVTFTPPPDFGPTSFGA
jgi:hypothetical protein